MPVSLYEFAGGRSAFLALAAAHHARCLADPELNHPFSHPDQDPHHVERLAAYWAEVLGGPPDYSTSCGDQTSLLRMHAGNGDMGDLGRRFVECFVAALDDARLPEDPRFRAAMRAYMEWAVADVLAYSPVDATVPEQASMPHWSWGGLSPDTIRDSALQRAHQHATTWLHSLGHRPVPARADADTVADALGRDLPDRPTEAADVVDLLSSACEPGLTAMPSGRFFGFVTGGSHPAALAADWLVSVWDQNAILRQVTPAVAAVEEVAAGWLLELLGLPERCGVGFVTGATAANVTGIAAGRDALLRRAGWDSARGLAGGPALRVVAGRERHDSVELALRYAGLPRPELVDVDAEGRVVPQALRLALDASPGVPTLVLLQAGNLHSGAFDPFEGCVELAHEHGAWVHVDGAFGLWAAASPSYAHLTAGVEAADSWATDAHKTLNVPYDCGIAVVRDPAALTAAMGTHGDYLIADAAGDPIDRVPEMSRRARGVPVWAALRALGRTGVAQMVDRMCAQARTFADAIGTIEGAEVLNDVVLTQVCAAFGDDERTRGVVARMLENGTAWTSGSRWRDRAVLRISVSNAGTTDDDVHRTVEALRRAAARP